MGAVCDMVAHEARSSLQEERNDAGCKDTECKHYTKIAVQVLFLHLSPDIFCLSTAFPHPLPFS
jgi:hypothetical protein